MRSSNLTFHKQQSYLFLIELIVGGDIHKNHNKLMEILVSSISLYAMIALCLFIK